MYCTERIDRMWHLSCRVVAATMRQSLKDAKEALAKALQGLEDIRMTPSDDPALSELKADIRRTIKRPAPEDELAAAA